MRQGLRSEIHATLYRNHIGPKDWLIFLEVVAKAESSIHLEHKSFSQPTRIRRQLKKSRRKVHQINTMRGRPQEVTPPVEIFEASLGGMVVTEEADLPILAPRLVLQTLPSSPLRRTRVKTVVTDVEN